MSEEEMATFCELMKKLVESNGGGIYGMITVVNNDTGKSLTLHVDIHDAALCEHRMLENIDATIGTLQ